MSSFKINCIAIDDEPLALDVIVAHVSKIPSLSLTGAVKRATEAIELLEKEKIDLLFLDVQMPELTGFEILNTIRSKPLVIFTTAYPDFALESYNIDAVDFLLKPVSFNRLLKAVNKAKSLLHFNQPSAIKNNVAPIKDEFLFVKSGYKTVKILLSEILYLESIKDYVVFYLPDKKIQSLLSMKDVEEALPSDKFIRIHRSFIISLDKIDFIERNVVHIGKQTLTVGDFYKDNFNAIVTSKRIN